MTTFTQKQLRFKFVLANTSQKFDTSGNNTLSVTGLRASVIAKSAGAPAFPEADIRIYGLRQDDMNLLTALQLGAIGAGDTVAFNNNAVTVEANSGDGWSTVYAGSIYSAGPDYSAMPAVSFRASARLLYYASMTPAEVTSYTGPTDAVTVIENIAAKQGLKVENNGVSGISLSSPYFAGVLPDQLRDACSQAGITYWLDPSFPVVAIAPVGRPRNTPVWVLSPATGLVGYPTIDSLGYVRVRAVYNPAFRFGSRLTITGSDVPRANGQWAIRRLTNTLESQNPGGPWFSDIECWPLNLALVG